MASFVTERWSDRAYTPLGSASRSFDAVGYTSGPKAIAATINNFGVRVGTTYPEDSYMYVQLGGITARPNQGPTTWIVSVPYAYISNLSSTIPQETNPDPLQRETVWEIIPGIDTIDIDQDYAWNTIGNSAGSPASPKARMTVRTLNITATRFYNNFSLDIAFNYMNRVNSEPIQIKSLGLIQANQMLCPYIGPTKPFTLSGPNIIEVLHRFEIRSTLVSGLDNDPGFLWRQLDKGFSGWYKDPADSAVKQGDFSEPDPDRPGHFRIRTIETLLDGNGMPLDNLFKPGSIMIGENNPQTPVPAPSGRAPGNPAVKRTRTATGAFVLDYRTYKQVDFSPLIASL